MPAPQNYIDSANAYQGIWAFPVRFPVAGSTTTIAQGDRNIFHFDTMVMERGGQAQTNITAFNNSVASGMICTVWIQLPAGAGVSTFILSQDLGDGIWLDLPTFNLAAGLNQYVSPVLAAFKVKGRINTTNAALVIWHAQMAGY